MFSSSSGSKSFTMFPKLPLEFQRLVLKFASFEHRHVPVAAKNQHSLSRQVTGENKSKQLVRFRSDTPIPTLFSVCRESRSEAKRHYKKALVTEHNFSFFSIGLTPRFYINPVSDVICPVGDVFGDITIILMAAMHKAQCQNIALDQSQWGELVDDFEGPSNVDQWMCSSVRPPHSLKSITLYRGAGYGTPYKDGSRGFPHNISSVDWNTTRKKDKCTLGFMITELHRSITRYRDLIPKMVQDRHDVERGRVSPPPHPLLTRLPIFFDLSTKVLEEWTPPRVTLLMHGVPNSLTSVLTSRNPFEIWHCGVRWCPDCTSSVYVT
ncbi:hypothetical protein BOTCAL_0624g00030 [Botryotinia calthae]|uniref:2EXR domain-containing protein n=1 Tax=Botryotinia calthae TaxID=38488 RepID=A0A4Y8CL13_9HELO|nr:hypothetical protein BOTCAL_0624g00030 [Botryotinia calthae]